MTKFEQWCDSKGYPVESGIHTHVLSNWADEFAAAEIQRYAQYMKNHGFCPDQAYCNHIDGCMASFTKE